MKYTTPKQIGDYNKNMLLSVLRSGGPTSRVELSRQLELSPTAVTKNTARLLENGIIEECGSEESNMGRKPTLIKLCEDFCYVVGVDIVGGVLKVALANFSGTIVKYSEEPACEDCDAEAFLDQVIKLLQKHIDASGVPVEKIWAIIIGAPGIFDSESGKSRSTFFLDGWEDIDIRKRILDALSIETIIENDVNLDVIGENWHNVAKEYDSILYVKLGQGFAARIVLQGKLLRGFHNMAGEIGYMLPDLTNESTQMKNYENMLCNEAIAHKYADLKGKNKVKGIADVCRLAKKGDDVADVVMQDLFSQFAIAMHNSVVVFDPQVIILGGDACCFSKKEIKLIKQKMKTYFPYNQNIVTSRLGNESCLYGAVKVGIDYVEDRITNIW